MRWVKIILITLAFCLLVYAFRNPESGGATLRALGRDIIGLMSEIGAMISYLLT